MDEKETQQFVARWNAANGFPDGLTELPNMRYVRPGVVTWNAYDAPELELLQLVDLLREDGRS